ncbi:dihydropteroate synthase [Ectothiorhodospiraceae bacterium WFHF3C12]|nr:dihydropteroate synthase [Ectothiorhodospiraceae bacterium WFHF3C12]
MDHCPAAPAPPGREEISAVLDCAGKQLSLDAPQVMGVLNVTPDSFSDGGDFVSTSAALDHARAMVAAGAAIIDIGGESTRPGADEVPETEELRRVIPIVEALSEALDVPVSVDTTKPGVMRRAAAAGAGLVNDVLALRAPGALETMAELEGVPVCLMHMQGTPRTMQRDPEYGDVVAEVHAFLGERIAACEAAGIGRERLLVDPGFGFGKHMNHNAALLCHLERFQDLGCPVLIGLSRKSFIGNILDLPPKERVSGSVAAAVLAAWKGARIVRAHDVAETVQALRVVDFVARHGAGDGTVQ